jgi:hypothetical protein
MRTQDRMVFAACGIAMRYWILVRRTNPESLKYIGRKGFVPKPIDCKPKTADKGPHAGLVVSPEIHTDAFNDEKSVEAVSCWEEFKSTVLTASGRSYSVDDDPTSLWYGCVLLGYDKIYGDYDLYDVVDPAQARRNFALVDTMHGQLHMRSPYLYKVMDWINHRIGAPVVQHSGEAQYKDHTDQTLDAFGPLGEYKELHNEAETRLFYSTQFEGRKALGKGVRW